MIKEKEISIKVLELVRKPHQNEDIIKPRQISVGNQLVIFLLKDAII